MIPSEVPSINGIAKGMEIVIYVVVDIRRKAPAAAAYTHYVTIMDTVPPLAWVPASCRRKEKQGGISNI